MLVCIWKYVLINSRRNKAYCNTLVGVAMLCYYTHSIGDVALRVTSAWHRWQLSLATLNRLWSVYKQGGGAWLIGANTGPGPSGERRASRHMLLPCPPGQTGIVMDCLTPITRTGILPANQPGILQGVIAMLCHCQSYQSEHDVPEL